MHVTVEVIAHSSEEVVLRRDNGDYLIRVKEPAHHNKANKRVIMLLARELSVPWNTIRLKNPRARKKQFVIESISLK